MLIANKGDEGRRKLAYKWESTVYVVINWNPQTHTYVVQDEKGNKTVVHRNLLLNINFLLFRRNLEEPVIRILMTVMMKGSQLLIHSPRILQIA